MMMLSLFFVGLFLGLVPDAEAVRREGRAALAEVLTVRAISRIADSELPALEASLRLLVERNDDVQSAAIRRADGEEIIQVGDHAGYWSPAESGYSTDNQITVPIVQASEQWGQLELRFASVLRPWWTGFIDNKHT